MNNYCLFDLSSKHVIYSHDVIFNESEFSFNSSLFLSTPTCDFLTEDFDLNICASHISVAQEDVVASDFSSYVVPEVIVTPVSYPVVSESSSGASSSSPPSEILLTSPAVLKSLPISFGK